MSSEIPVRLEEGSSKEMEQLFAHLRNIRKINFFSKIEPSASLLPHSNLLAQLTAISKILSVFNHFRESETLSEIYELSILSSDFGGLGLEPNSDLTPEDEKSILFLVSAYLESLNSQDRAKSIPSPLSSRPMGRRGMTLSEKILAAHDVERRGVLKPGDMARVDVDFIMASELSWRGMEKEYNTLGKPGIWRNDRLWLAGDHVVDPRIRNNVMVKELVKSSERARDEFRMTEYQGMNYTIMHTEFFRSRAQPGMLIIGSDSHTCSAGSLGCLSIGLGVSDVTMPLITGETWFKVPESVNIRFVGRPPPGIGGKDTILYILQQLKRNTVASDRVVEFTGPGLKHLSCDARFAIANMTTEFGGITGIFIPDQITYDFINHRKLSRNKKLGTYFRPDDDAVYAETHTIDLSQVSSFVALYPSPDDVVAVSHSKIAGKTLDGCFIGACTTAEEDLIIGAMVLEIGFQNGIMPVKRGKRRVVPGSLPILSRLRELGFVDIYERAGFTVGVPGCSYCVGMGADRAGEGEVWLSSQNRNFENRMGKGALGNLASAATVAASSLEMKVTDPKPYLDAIDRDKLREILGHASKAGSGKGPIYVEPSGHDHSTQWPAQAVRTEFAQLKEVMSDESTSKDVRVGKVQLLGDFIDTDALAPAEILTICKTNADFGEHCLKYTHPQFRARAAEGYNIVVAGKGFGCGSSRENAVSALLGCGIQAVIAKSFAFIYGRNAPNLGFLGVVIDDEGFHERVEDGAEIEIDLERGVVRLLGMVEEWRFEISDMERKLIEIGGLTSAFQKFGKGLFDALTIPKKQERVDKAAKEESGCGSESDLQW